MSPKESLEEWFWEIERANEQLLRDRPQIPLLDEEDSQINADASDPWWAHFPDLEKFQHFVERFIADYPDSNSVRLQLALHLSSLPDEEAAKRADEYLRFLVRLREVETCSDVVTIRLGGLQRPGCAASSGGALYAKGAEQRGPSENRTSGGWCGRVTAAQSPSLHPILFRGITIAGWGQ